MKQDLNVSCQLVNSYGSIPLDLLWMLLNRFNPTARMSEGVPHFDRPLVGTNNVFTQAPHQLEERVNDTPPAFDNSQPRSTKRKRGNEDSASLPTVRLQTSGFGTPKTHRAHDALEYEDNLSPRTFVSSQFQSLNIHNPEISATVPMTGRRTKRRTSWTVPIHLPGPTSLETEELLAREITNAASSPEDYESAAEDMSQETSTCSTADNFHSQRRDPVLQSSQQLNHDIEQAMYQFSAGSREQGKRTTPDKFVRDRDSPSPPEKPSIRLPPLDQESIPVPSPSKRRRRRSTSKSPPGSPLLISAETQNGNSSTTSIESPPVPKRRMSSPPPKLNRSDSSLISETESENSNLWWQDSEIVGHDPADPDDDARGVNGIGFQKTRAEQYRISQSKRKQITEWRNREAREARALRAAGRGSGSGIRSSAGKDMLDKPDKGHRVMLGRVTKSRSGSPVERRIDDVKSSSTPRKGVRFEER